MPLRTARTQTRLSKTLQRHGITQRQAAAALGIPFTTLSGYSSGRSDTPRHIFRTLALFRINLRLRRQIHRLRWLLWGDEGIAGQEPPTDLIGFIPTPTPTDRTATTPTDPQCQADAKSLIELHDWLADVYPGTPSLPALLRAAEILRKRTID